MFKEHKELRSWFLCLKTKFPIIEKTFNGEETIHSKRYCSSMTKIGNKNTHLNKIKLEPPLRSFVANS